MLCRSGFSLILELEHLSSELCLEILGHLLYLSLVILGHHLQLSLVFLGHHLHLSLVILDHHVNFCLQLSIFQLLSFELFGLLLEL